MNRLIFTFLSILIVCNLTACSTIGGGRNVRKLQAIDKAQYNNQKEISKKQKALIIAIKKTLDTIPKDKQTKELQLIEKFTNQLEITVHDVRPSIIIPVDGLLKDDKKAEATLNKFEAELKKDVDQKEKLQEEKKVVVDKIIKQFEKDQVIKENSLIWKIKKWSLIAGALVTVGIACYVYPPLLLFIPKLIMSVIRGICGMIKSLFS